MLIPDVLLTTPHLPIKIGTTVEEALQLCSSFYEVDLKPEDFQNTQTFINSKGFIVLELIKTDTDEVVITFVNTIPPRLNEGVNPCVVKEFSFINPFLLNNPADEFYLLAEPLTVTSKTEIEFLDALIPGETLSLTNNVGDFSFKLSRLLNDYGYVGRWVAGTSGLHSTAGFELIFKGPSKYAPASFFLEDSPCLVLIKIHQGETKGYLCIRT